MKQVITAKLKLHTPPEQFAALRATQLAYRDALNYTSRYAFERGKMSNQRRLQHGRMMTSVFSMGSLRKRLAMSRGRSIRPIAGRIDL
jgi:hypothetical protein